MGKFVNPGNGSFQVALNSEIYVDKTGLIRYTNKVINASITTPNFNYYGAGINNDVLDLKYGDYSLNNLKAPYGKYWYIDPDKVAESAKSTINWAKSKE